MLEEVLQAALSLSGKGSAATLLRTAAALTERAGYEAARNESRTSVTRMMLLAAELERLSATMSAPAVESDAASPVGFAAPAPASPAAGAGDDHAR